MPDWAAALFGAPRALLLAPILFCHRGYARAYLGSAFWAPLALPHYLLRGERRGHLPNPFFEPAVFATEAGTPSFLLYLAQRRLWSKRTSTRFDPAWYCKGARLPPAFNPLADFWRRGFDKRIDPAPSFDVGFFRDAVCRDQWDDRRYAYRVFAEATWQVPTQRAALRAAQDAFFAGIVFRVVTRAAPRHRHLVFVQAGRDFAAPHAMAPGAYDVLLNYYEEPAPGSTSSGASICVQNGTKATAIRLLLAREPALLLAYDAVLFLDDDVTIGAGTIEDLFATAERERLDLAQASLTPESGCFFEGLKQPAAGPGVRRLNAVEIMMPLASRRVLERFGWVFGEGISGWALDMLLGAEVRKAYGERSVGLVGHAVARHERPVDTADGRFYRLLRSHGIDAATEAGDIIARYRLDPDIAPLEPAGSAPAAERRSPQPHGLVAP